MCSLLIIPYLLSPNAPVRKGLQLVTQLARQNSGAMCQRGRNVAGENRESKIETAVISTLQEVEIMKSGTQIMECYVNT